MKDFVKVVKNNMTKKLERLIENESIAWLRLLSIQVEIATKIQKMCNFTIDDVFRQPDDGLCVLVCEPNERGFEDNNYTVETIIALYEKLGRKLNQSDIVGI